MGEWWDADQHGKPPAPQLVEQIPTPRLVDRFGRWLVKEKRVGFRPPKATPGPDSSRVQREGQEAAQEGGGAVDPPRRTTR